MTNEDILVELIIRKFVILYNKKMCSKYSTYKEDRSILGNGYCLYFAMLLKKIYSEGNILSTNEFHYIFQYKKHFYDFRGNIPVFENIIELYPNHCIFLDNLCVATEEDIYIAELSGIIDKYKNLVWSSIEPDLLEYANKIKEKIPTFKKSLKNPS